MTNYWSVDVSETGPSDYSDHSDFIGRQREYRDSLLGAGYRFVGHIRPERYASASYEAQEAALRQSLGDVTELIFIGDCSEATRPGVEGTTLEYADGWVAVYAPELTAPSE